MMIISLTTWERITLQVAIEELPGKLPVGFLRNSFALVDILEFSPGEQKQANIVILPDGNLQFPDDGREWELELPKKAVREVMPVVLNVGFRSSRLVLALIDKLEQLVKEVQNEHSEK